MISDVTSRPPAPTPDRSLSAPSGPRHHGGISTRQLHARNIDPSRLVDFSVNINPFGPSPRVREAIIRAPLHLYPDPESWEARSALQRKYSIPIERIALGAGACELLFGLVRMFHGPGTFALVVEPTFSEYTAAVHSVGGSVVSVRAQEEDGFAFPLEMALRSARDPRVASIYLCSPTSPLGQFVPPKTLATLAAAVAPLPIILDESFLSLSTRPHPERRVATPLSTEPLLENLGISSAPDNIVRVRSLTKDLGVPGLRVGYLIAQEEWVARLEDFRPRWSVSAAAQAAVLAATQDDDFLEQSRRRIDELRPELVELLYHFGFRAVPSVTNYCTARSPVPVRTLHSELLEKHAVLIRDCSSFGLPHHARFAVRPRSDLDRLNEALRSVVPPLIEKTGVPT